MFSRVFVSLTHLPTGDRGGLLRYFDLSKNRSLRTLEVAIDRITRYCVDAPRFLRNLLSTITSPLFSEVVLISEPVSEGHAILRPSLINIVGGMYQVKPFRLVFCLWVWDGDQGDAMERFKAGLDEEVVQGTFGFLTYPPVILSYTRLAWHRENVGNILPLTTGLPDYDASRDLRVWSGPRNTWRSL